MGFRMSGRCSGGVGAASTVYVDASWLLAWAERAYDLVFRSSGVCFCVVANWDGGFTGVVGCVSLNELLSLYLMLLAITLTP